MGKGLKKKKKDSWEISNQPIRCDSKADFSTGDLLLGPKGPEHWLG